MIPTLAEFVFAFTEVVHFGLTEVVADFIENQRKGDKKIAMSDKKDMRDPRIIQFLVEAYENEKIFRARFNRKNEQQIRQAAVYRRPPKFNDKEDIARVALAGEMAMLSRGHITGAVHKLTRPQRDIDTIQGTARLRQGVTTLSVGDGDPKDDLCLARPDTDLNVDPIMRPVDPQLKGKPYRKVYLKERGKIPPEEKYYFQECSSWDYGWRLKDNKFKQETQYVIEAVIPQWVICSSASALLLVVIAALYRNTSLKKKPEKPLIDFQDQSFVESGPERIHASKLYKDPNENDLLLYFDDDTRTLYEAFRRGLKESNNGNCLGWREGPGKPYVWQNYQDTLTRAQNFGSGLLKFGVLPGQNTNIGLYLKNCPEWVMVEQAAYCYSMVIVPMYDTSDGPSCCHIINQTQMAVIVCENDEKANVLLENLARSVKIIVTIKGVRIETYERAKSQGVIILTFNEMEMLGSQKLTPCSPPKPDDLCTICYTSGTTGLPKGVMLTHANLIACICGVSVHLGDNKLNCKDVTLSFLPLSHMLERYFEQSLYIVGGSVGFYSGDIRNLTDDLITLKPTVIPAVPRILNKMYDRAQADISQSKIRSTLFAMAMKAKKEELKRGIIRNNSIWDYLVFRKIRKSTGGRLRYMFVSSAPLAGSVLTFVRCALSCQVVESYGQTESTASMATTIWGEYIPNHVGPPIACCKIKLTDVPEMNYYSYKKQGEICVKGANVFKGYFKDPVKTKEVLDEEGWLHTGDIGQWLSNGTLRIIDRKKHIFKLSQGEYVAPEKIQNIYLRSQFVEQVFVYGESMKSCLIGIVVPVKDVLVGWAVDNGVQGTIEELCENKKVKEVIMDSMVECGKAATLKHFEQVKDIHLHAEPFAAANGLLTQTMKTKRPEIKNYFQEQLQTMYECLD